jgi:hypothetical protein
MKKILVLCHVPPDRITHTTMLFQNILPILKEKIDVEVIWVVLMSKKIKNYKISENERVVDIRNFNNFSEIIDNEKPDLVYAAATFSFIDYAASISAKHNNIPVLSRWYNPLDDDSGKQNELIKSYAKRFLEKTTPSDEENDSKIIMKRVRFFMYKYWFLMKTLKSINIKLPRRFMISLKILNYFLNMGKKRVLPEFANTMHWLENKSVYNELHNAGYKKQSLVVTGNPMYDDAFKKIKNKTISKSEKIKILFAPIALFEHGLMTKKQNEFTFKTILQTINSEKNFDVEIKIHPTTQNLKYYQKLTHDVNESIPLVKNGHILDHILEADILITYIGNSSVHVNALISKKPIIVCNFFNKEPGTYVNQNLIKECTNPQELKKIIFENKMFQNKNIDEFITKHFYKNDGKSSKRLCDVIIKMILHDG